MEFRIKVAGEVMVRLGRQFTQTAVLSVGGEVPLGAPFRLQEAYNIKVSPNAVASLSG